MKIQAYLTAAEINLKRLAAAILALLARFGLPVPHKGITVLKSKMALPLGGGKTRPASKHATVSFFNDPVVHFYLNVFSHVPATKVREYAICSRPSMSRKAGTPPSGRLMLSSPTCGTVK